MIVVMEAGEASVIDLGDAEWVLKANFDRQAFDLLIEGRDGEQVLIRDYFAQGEPPALQLGPEGALQGHVVASLAGPMAEGQYAQNGTSDGSAVGFVDDVAGGAWATRVDGSRVELSPGAEIYLGDVIETSSDGSVVIAFVDETTFALSEDARMVIDELVYDPGSSSNTASFSLVQGLFVMVSGDVAKTGEMTIETPVSTIGIRGTSVAIQAAAEGLQNLITLLQDPDGNVGIVEVATAIASVILDSIGASTIVTSNGQPPTAVQILSSIDIETSFKAALATMQTLRGSNLGVNRDVDGTGVDGTTGPDTTPGGTEGDGETTESDAEVDPNAANTEPDQQDADDFADALESLLAALEENGVDIDDLIQQSLAEDEPVAPPTVEDQPVEAVGADGTPRNDDPTTETGTTEDDTGFTTSDGGFTVVDESGDAFVMHEDGVQFGAAASGAFGTAGDAPTDFANQDQPVGFFLDPNNLGTFSDPITSGTPAAGFTATYVNSPTTTLTGSTANVINDLGMSSTATISGNQGLVTSTDNNGTLSITQVVSLTAGQTFLVASVTLENLASSYLSDIAYLLSINPNQDAGNASPTDDTFNQVITNPSSSGEAAVMATGPNSGVDFALYSNQTEINEENGLAADTVEVNAAVSPVNTFETDPSQSYLFDSPNLGGTTDDVAINLTYEINMLGVGESVTLTYIMTMNFVTEDDDFLIAAPGSNTVDGAGGDDTIIGSGENDLLSGGTGADVVNAGGGNDTVVWTLGDGTDSVDGGADTDLLQIETQADGDTTGAADTVTLSQTGSDNDLMVVVNGGTAVVATSIETVDVFTGDGDDSLTVSNISGTDVTNNTVRAELGAGDDYASGAAGFRNVQFLGEGGDDTLIGSTLNDFIDGGSGNDSLFGNVGDDTLYGDTGNDFLQGAAGDDTEFGGSGNDSITGGANNDYLSGDSGDDTLDGGSDTDFLFGGSGNDDLAGGSGTDYLTGGSGNDTLAGDTGNDTISAGTGNDLITWQTGDTGTASDGSDNIDGDADCPSSEHLGRVSSFSN